MTKIDLNRRKYIEHLSKLGINLVQPFFLLLLHLALGVRFPSVITSQN